MAPIFATSIRKKKVLNNTLTWRLSKYGADLNYPDKTTKVGHSNRVFFLIGFT